MLYAWLCSMGPGLVLTCEHEVLGATTRNATKNLLPTVLFFFSSTVLPFRKGNNHKLASDS